MNATAREDNVATVGFSTFGELTREGILKVLRQGVVQLTGKAAVTIGESRKGLREGDGSTKEEDAMSHLAKEAEVKDIGKSQSYALKWFDAFLGDKGGTRPPLVDEGSIFVLKEIDGRNWGRLEMLLITPEFCFLPIPLLQDRLEETFAGELVGMSAYIVFSDCPFYTDNLKGKILREGAEIVTQVTDNPDTIREVVRVL